MKDGWQITNVTRRQEDGFVTNVTCVYAQTASNHIEKIRYIIANEYNGIDDDFIPFEDLTEDVLLEWCFDVMEDEKEVLEDKIDNKHTDYVTNRDKELEHIDGLPY